MRNRKIALSLVFAAWGAAGCSQQAINSPSEVTAMAAGTLPADPGDPVWENAPEHVARLVPQDLVEPRQMEVTTAEVRVRAVAAGDQIAFRLEWDDPTVDSLPGAARFSDACAVQLPARTETDLPAPQMGESGRPVEITVWKASWQATVDGRADSIRELYPNASIDHYPFEAKPLEPGSAAQQEMAARYSPARALGNAMEGPRDRPVENLRADGPGTLLPLASGGSDGRGVRTGTGWSVVISRGLPGDSRSAARFHVALAVWEGSQQETGARKMRTGWIPLSLPEKP